MKEVETQCPCCDATLVVDVATGRVLRHAKSGQVDETGKMQLDEGRWESANERSSSRGVDALDKFEQAHNEANNQQNNGF